MIGKASTSCTLALGLVALAGAMPAQAAKPVPVRAECSANKIGWTEPREFTVSFERTSNSLKSVEVNEQQRVFTPTDVTAVYTTGKRGGVIVDVPAQRPGRWTGKPKGEVDEFELKTRDGGASFTLAPDGTDATRKRLTWKAEMSGGDGEVLTAQGDGSCRLDSSAEANRPAVEAPREAELATESPRKEDPSTQSPRKEDPAAQSPRKEFRLFGGHRGRPADSGEAK
jgi:hypothetical protein